MLPSHWKKNGRVESKRRAATKRGPTAASKDSAKSAKAQMANTSEDASQAATIMTKLIISLTIISSQIFRLPTRLSLSSSLYAVTISLMLDIRQEERREGKECVHTCR